MSPDLPIVVYPSREILEKLRENFQDNSIDQSTELEIHSLVYIGDAGGVVGELRTKSWDTKKAKAAFLASVTHCRVKKGEPHYWELEKYRVKRIRRIGRQNRGSQYF